MKVNVDMETGLFDNPTPGVLTDEIPGGVVTLLVDGEPKPPSSRVTLRFHLTLSKVARDCDVFDPPAKADYWENGAALRAFADSARHAGYDVAGW